MSDLTAATRVYVEAYDDNARPILGNMSGQTVANAAGWRMTRRIQALRTGLGRPNYERVAYWRVVRGDGIELARFVNTKR